MEHGSFFLIFRGFAVLNTGSRAIELASRRGIPLAYYKFKQLFCSSTTNNAAENVANASGQMITQKHDNLDEALQLN